MTLLTRSDFSAALRTLCTISQLGLTSFSIRLSYARGVAMWMIASALLAGSSKTFGVVMSAASTKDNRPDETCDAYLSRKNASDFANDLKTAMTAMLGSARRWARVVAPREPVAPVKSTV